MSFVVLDNGPAKRQKKNNERNFRGFMRLSLRRLEEKEMERGKTTLKKIPTVSIIEVLWGDIVNKWQRIKIKIKKAPRIHPKIGANVTAIGPPSTMATVTWCFN